MTPAAPNRVQAAEVDYQGFNLQQTHDKVYAVACSLGLADVSLLDEAKPLATSRRRHVSVRRVAGGSLVGDSHRPSQPAGIVR